MLVAGVPNEFVVLAPKVFVVAVPKVFDVGVPNVVTVVAVDDGVSIALAALANNEVGFC